MRNWQLLNFWFWLTTAIYFIPYLLAYSTYNLSKFLSGNLLLKTLDVFEVSTSFIFSDWIGFPLAVTIILTAIYSLRCIRLIFENTLLIYAIITLLLVFLFLLFRESIITPLTLIAIYIFIYLHKEKIATNGSVSSQIPEA